LLIFSGVAQAADGVGFRIALHAPEHAACISADRLTSLVEERTGRTAVGGSGPRLTVDVVIERREPGYRALVSTSDSSGRDAGQRELLVEGACTALDEMLTLVISSSVGVASVLQPTAATPPAPRVPLQEAHPLQVASKPASTETDNDGLATPSRTPAAPWNLELSASARGLTGVLPNPGLGAALGVFAKHGGIWLGVSGTWLAPVTAVWRRLEWRATGGWAELNLCSGPALPWQASVAFCAGLQAGALRASAEGLWNSTPRVDALVQLAPSVRAGIGLVSRLALIFAIGATCPIVFPRYAFLDAASQLTPYHAVGLGVWAELGISIRVAP
jgi:hypothetical protein